MNADFLQLLAWYFALPIALIAVAKFYTYFVLKNRELDPLTETGLFNALSIGIAVIFWPLVIPVLWLGTKYEDEWFSDKPKPHFWCQHHYLGNAVSVEHAEVSGKVCDPLHRAPDVPFGHLNQAWQVFIAKKRYGYRLWQFTIPGDSEREDGTLWSKPRGRKVGFAWVRLWAVKAEFIYEWDA